MLKYHIFGCKTNKYYAEKWLRSGFLQDKSGIFIASCVVTDHTKRKLIHFIKKSMEHLQEGERLFLSGCAPIQ